MITSIVSPQRVLPQPSVNTPSGCRAVNRKKPDSKASIRVSPWYSAQDRNACSIGMCGHRSACPLRLLRSRDGPKKPSAEAVARTASTHRSVSVRTRLSPVT
jgi:hypothetical protein